MPEITLLVALLYTLLGVVTGIFSGLLGIGGSIIIIPALALLMPLHAHHATPMLTSQATARACMLFTTGSALLSHLLHKHLDLTICKRFIPGAVIGLILGILCTLHLSDQLLAWLFGLMLLYVGIKLLISKNKVASGHKDIPKLSQLTLASLGIAFISGLVGVSGGIFITPYWLNRLDSVSNATAISAATSFVLAIVGTIQWVLIDHSSKVNHHYIHWGSVFCIGIGCLIGAPLGVKLGKILPKKWVKLIFIVLIVVTLVKLV